MPASCTTLFLPVSLCQAGIFRISRGHGARLNDPTWHDSTTQFLAFTIAGLSANEENLHVILNMAGVAVDAQLPPIPGRKWYPVVDTSDRATTGILPREKQPAVFSMMWRVAPHSRVIF